MQGLKEHLWDVATSQFSIRLNELLALCDEGMSFDDFNKIMYNILGWQVSKGIIRQHPMPTRKQGESDVHYSIACQHIENENESNAEWTYKLRKYEKSTGLTMNDHHSEWFDYIIGKSDEQPALVDSIPEPEADIPF